MTGGVGPGSSPQSSSPVLLFWNFFLAEFFPDFFAERCVLRQDWVPMLALLVTVVASSSCAGEDPAELTRFLAVATGSERRKARRVAATGS